MSRQLQALSDMRLGQALLTFDNNSKGEIFSVKETLVDWKQSVKGLNKGSETPRDPYR